MRVAVGIDHAGTPLRDTVFEAVRAGGHELLAAFCAARFSGEQRHVRRLNKIFEMERDGMDGSEASP